MSDGVGFLAAESIHCPIPYAAENLRSRLRADEPQSRGLSVPQPGPILSEERVAFDHADSNLPFSMIAVPGFPAATRDSGGDVKR